MPTGKITHVAPKPSPLIFFDAGRTTRGLQTAGLGSSSKNSAAEPEGIAIERFLSRFGENGVINKETNLWINCPRDGIKYIYPYFF